MCVSEPIFIKGATSGTGDSKLIDYGVHIGEYISYQIFCIWPISVFVYKEALAP